MNAEARNWLCYDAECALCLRWVKRFRALLEKHGFTLLPLQSPDARAALRLPEADLMKEMRVITANGRVIGGADALAYISHIVCKPAFGLTRIPGAMPLLRRAYQFLAHKRDCRNGACRGLRKNSPIGTPARKRRHHGVTTFFEMP
jgi:predicted DCC family thiol-disulfide oxidoreductase YuxK